MLWSHVLKLGDWNLMMKVQSYRKMKNRTEGTSSLVKGTTLHCIYLDYDNIEDGRLNEELGILQDDFQIGNFYVFETRDKGRHAVCIDALRFQEVRQTVDFSCCDLMFKRAPSINEYRCWVLRFTEKGDRDAPRYLRTIESPYEGTNLQSLGHARFLESMYGLKIALKNPCGDECIEVQSYNTGTRVSVEELKNE